MENERLITIPERIYWLFKESALERMDDLQTGLDGGYYEQGKAELDALDRAIDEVRPYEKNRDIRFENHYECPQCGHKWSDTWSATCDDDCPECGKRHISPYASDDLL